MVPRITGGSFLLRKRNPSREWTRTQARGRREGCVGRHQREWQEHYHKADCKAVRREPRSRVYRREGRSRRAVGESSDESLLPEAGRRAFQQKLARQSST